MPSVFPGALDSLTNPSPTSKQDLVPHSAQHGNANDAIEAIQATIGVTGSSVAGTLEKRLILLESGGIETQSGIFSPWIRGAVGDLVADDHAAIQDAIDDAYAAGGGMVGPLGKHKCSAGLVRRPGVDMFGMGWQFSELNFPTDLGSGVKAIDYDTAHVLGGPVAGIMQDFSIIGPGPFTLGVQTCNMDGVRPIAHSVLQRLFIAGFRAGVDIYWDHIRLRDCLLTQNYFNALFGPDPATTGNQSFFGCIMVQPSYASIGLAGSHPMDQVQLLACHFGFGPFGIYRANMGGTNRQGISNCVFDSSTFELCGNAAIFDETTGSGNEDTIYNSTFLRNTYSSSNNVAHRIGAKPYDAAVVTRNMRALDIRESHLPFSVPTGGTSIFKCSGIVAGVTDHRPPSGWTGTYPTGADQLINPGTLNFANGLTVETADYRGRIRTAVGTITKGDILQYSTTQGWVTRMTATGTFAGIALTDAVNAGTVLVAPPGEEVSVMCEPITAAGAAIRPVLVSGTEYNHGDDSGSGPIIGYSTSPGGSSGGALLLVTTRSP